jgi:hypothetical protein
VGAGVACEDHGDGAEVLRIPPGGTGVFQNSPYNRIRIDAADPTSVAVTARTTIDGHVLAASASTTWIAVDEEPGGEGQPTILSGTVLAFDHVAQWYLLQSDNDRTVFIQYTAGKNDFYLIGNRGVELAEFQERIALGGTMDYELSSYGEQVHWLPASQ